jgi:hypothetical protein
MDKILIDTDVILDFFFDREPFSEFATTIISWSEKKKIEGFITPESRYIRHENRLGRPHIPGGTIKDINRQTACRGLFRSIP